MQATFSAVLVPVFLAADIPEHVMAAQVLVGVDTTSPLKTAPDQTAQRL
jgi:hypothetical protein